MNGLFCGFFSRAFNFLGADGIFLISIITLSCVFTISLIVFRVKRISSIKRRAWIIFISLGIVLCQTGTGFFTGGLSFSFITLGVATIYCAIALYAPIKVPLFTDEQLSFAKEICKKAEQSVVDAPENDHAFDKVETITPSTKKETSKKAEETELDFSHVKSVLKRMEYYSLSQSDKRQIKELETAVFQAENGELTPLLKSKINDGLGALLKIMSKYGI